MKKRWSEECNSYFDQKHYITITLTQFLALYKAMKANVAQLGELETPEQYHSITGEYHFIRAG